MNHTMASKFKSMALISFVALSLTSCFNTTPADHAVDGKPVASDKDVTDGEQPIFSVRGGRQIVYFESEASEAWDVQTNGPQIYLNYAKFMYGTRRYVGTPTLVCTSVFGDLKVVGVGLGASFLKKAVFLTGYTKTSQSNVRIKCDTLENRLQRDRGDSDLQHVFDTM